MVSVAFRALRFIPPFRLASFLSRFFFFFAILKPSAGRAPFAKTLLFRTFLPLVPTSSLPLCFLMLLLVAGFGEILLVTSTGEWEDSLLDILPLNWSRSSASLSFSLPVDIWRSDFPPLIMGSFGIFIMRSRSAELSTRKFIGEHEM